MSNNNEKRQERLLPTYRWDEGSKLSDSETELRSYTSRLLNDFRTQAVEAGYDDLPPSDIIDAIATMNVAKRSSATRRAERLIADGVIQRPPASLIPTFMQSGHEIIGLEDRYMTNDHPSQELFAYNRLAKRSWLNRRFGEHCLQAIGFAHPHGIVKASDAVTRVKAHSTVHVGLSSGHATGPDEWVIVSSKSPIATIEENGRQASLISRVTGAVDVTSPVLKPDVIEAITDLARHEIIPEHAANTVLGQKAVLLDAILAHDEREDNPFYPVIQTVYLTQLAQKP